MLPFRGGNTHRAARWPTGYQSNREPPSLVSSRLAMKQRVNDRAPGGHPGHPRFPAKTRSTGNTRVSCLADETTSRDIDVDVHGGSDND